MLYYWPALQSTHMTHLWDSIRTEWDELLAMEALEPVYLKYLKQNASLFFDVSTGDKVVISEARLSHEYAVDFVVARSQRSLGFIYDFIEFESPQDSLFRVVRALVSPFATRANYCL